MGMRELHTPLKWIGIRLFKSYDGNYYIKVGKRPRKRLFRSQEHRMTREIAN